MILPVISLTTIIPAHAVEATLCALHADTDAAASHHIGTLQTLCEGGGRVYARRGRSSTRQPRRYSQSTVSTRKHHGPVTGSRCSANFAFVAAEYDGSLHVVR